MRDNFSKKVKVELANRAGCRCSNPSCGKLTSGPKEGFEGSINIGEAAHICAASKGGMRYNPNMTSEERSSIENGIWLCSNCAKLIDRDPSYTVATWFKWKYEAERRANDEIISNTTQKVVVGLDEFDINILQSIIQVLEQGNIEYMLKEHDFHGHFQKEYLNPIFELLQELGKPSKKPHNKEFGIRVNCFLNEISELRNLITFKGGPSRFGGGSFIIDFEEDQERCNDVCDNIYRKYIELIEFNNSFY